MTETLVRKFYLERKCSCSATIFNAVNQRGKLDLQGRCTQVMDSFCLDLRGEDICQAYTAAGLVLCLLYAQNDAQANQDMAADMQRTLREFFLQCYGSCRCGLIRLNHARGDVGCLHILESVTELLWELSSHLGPQPC